MKTKYTAEDIKALIEVMEDDLFDDLLNHVSHAQTTSDIVDGMEESIWAQGDKLSEKLILLLFPSEGVRDIKGKRQGDSDQTRWHHI